MIDLLLLGLLLGVGIGTLVVWQYRDYKLTKKSGVKDGRRNKLKDSYKD